MDKNTITHMIVSKRTVSVILIVVLYAGLSILVRWALATQLSTVLPGGTEDTLMHYWNGWATKQSLMQGRTLYETIFIFFPDGVSLATHNMAWLQILPWLVLSQWLDGIVAYNVVLLLHLTLCGLAMCWLVYTLTGNGYTAVFAGIVYLAWPFRLSQLDHPNLLATEWIPIFLLVLTLLLKEKRWRYVVGTAVAFALVGYTRWQILIPTVIIGTIYVVWHWRFGENKGDWHTLKLLAAAGGLSLVVMSPYLYILGQELRGSMTTSDLLREGEDRIMQTDMQAYIVPSNQHFWARTQTESVYDTLYAARSSTRRYSPYVGISVLLLLALALWGKRKTAVPWLLMAITLMLLALGPELRFGGELYPEVPMLYRFLEPVKILRLMRLPDRFNMFLALPVSVLAGYGAAVLWCQFKKRGRMVVLLLSIVVMVEYLGIPASLYQIPQMPVVYAQLADEVEVGGETAVINLPFGVLATKWYMFSQITHQRPIVQGKIARIPPSAYDYINQNPFLNSLFYVGEIDPALKNVTHQLDDLAENGIEYIIIHKNRVGADRILHWQRYLPALPMFEDEQIILYRTAPVAGQDYELLAELAPGLGSVRLLTSSDCLMAGNQLEIDVAWGSSRAITEDYDAEIQFSDEAGVIHHSELFPLSEQWDTSSWAANSLVWEYYQINLPQTLPPATYEVQVRLHDQQGFVGESYPLHNLTVAELPCSSMALRENVQAQNGLFGEQLRLVGYQVEQGDPAWVTLFWQANQHMDNDYKIFIHIYDLQTAVPVAQDDAMPHRNAYPTRFWGLEEVVDDRIPIYLGGVPAGNYGVAIGVYDSVTGERLTAVDSTGEISPDGRLILPETITVP